MLLRVPYSLILSSAGPEWPGAADAVNGDNAAADGTLLLISPLRL